MEVLQHKDGVLTARMRTGEGSCVIKTFENAESPCEIVNYRILEALNVPTLRVLGCTDRSVTLEDICASDRWRLGTEADLSDPAVGRALARWYRQLHERGRYAATDGMYDESDLFTMDNIRKLPQFTETWSKPVWNVLEQLFVIIRAALDALPRTMTYNDFWWTNLAVSRDGREAMMFDYNRMGRGYVCSDIRNVIVSLSPEAARAFQAEYGDVDPLEQALDDVVSHIVTLILASEREDFPQWAEPSRAALDEMPDRIEKLLMML